MSICLDQREGHHHCGIWQLPRGAIPPLNQRGTLALICCDHHKIICGYMEGVGVCWGPYHVSGFRGCRLYTDDQKRWYIHLCGQALEQTQDDRKCISLGFDNEDMAWERLQQILQWYHRTTGKTIPLPSHRNII